MKVIGSCSRSCKMKLSPPQQYSHHSPMSGCRRKIGQARGANWRQPTKPTQPAPAEGRCSTSYQRRHGTGAADERVCCLCPARELSGSGSAVPQRPCLQLCRYVVCTVSGGQHGHDSCLQAVATTPIVLRLDVTFAFIKF